MSWEQKKMYLDTTLIVKWAEEMKKKEIRGRAPASAGTQTFESWVIDVLGLVTTGLCQYLRYNVENGHTPETGGHADSPAPSRGM